MPNIRRGPYHIATCAFYDTARQEIQEKLVQSGCVSRILGFFRWDFSWAMGVNLPFQRRRVFQSGGLIVAEFFQSSEVFLPWDLPCAEGL